MFWLDKGVSGFRVDAVNHLFEVEDLRDEPETGTVKDSNSYEFLHHYYTKDLVRIEVYNRNRNLKDFRDCFLCVVLCFAARSLRNDIQLEGTFG